MEKSSALLPSAVIALGIVILGYLGSALDAEFLLTGKFCLTIRTFHNLHLPFI